MEEKLIKVVSPEGGAIKVGGKFCEKDIRIDVSNVFKQGQKSEYDRFWDSFQNFGKKTYYAYVFAGGGWTPENCRPKYDITATERADYCFSNSGNMNCDMVEWLEKCGINFTTKGAWTIAYLFNYSAFTHVGTIDITALTTIPYHAFAYSNIEKIDEMVIGDNLSLEIGDYILRNARKLVDITINGTFIVSINIGESTLLSKSSIISIINSLSANASNLNAIFSLQAVNKAFETLSGATDGSISEEWLTLVNTKPNWTISLV